MADCNKIKNEGIKKINAGYNPIIEEIGKIIANMKKKGLDPRKYYDANKDEVIDLIAFVEDLNKEKKEDIKEIKEKVDNECLSDNEEFLQTIIDTAIAFYTDGLSLILPKHMTHIDVKEILAGKPLGGDNSVFNQVRDSIMDGMGLGENNDLRRVIDDPVNTTSNTVRRILRGIGIRL
jgi:hypothetical protein